MTMKTLTLASLLVSIFLGKLMLAAPSASAAEPVSARAAFERLKTLAGEWRGTIDKRGEGDPVAVGYRVTASGHAVVETLFPGSAHEMVTVYHLDRDRLVLTHYCAAGNQPQMAMTRKSTPDALDFDFTGGANIKPGKDGHMHALRLHFLGPNELKAEWDSFKNGRKAVTKTFFVTRR